MAEGVKAGTVSGDWSLPAQAVTDLSPLNVALTAAQPGWNQIFRERDLPEPNYSVHMDVLIQPQSNPPPDQQVGLYCLYEDKDNHAEAVIDLVKHTLSTHGVVAGLEQPWREHPLPPNFDPTIPHHLECNKMADAFTFWFDRLSGSGVLAGRHFQLSSGQFGLLVRGTNATYSTIGIN